MRSHMRYALKVCVRKCMFSRYELMILTYVLEVCVENICVEDMCCINDLDVCFQTMISGYVLDVYSYCSY